ncbi:hypothetical protein EMIHUDRAFT_364989 [Emiliania huxleyi CCMP1516]|uniref:Ferrochelatase n=2 Tax=Emiliania huxleyi TaxID=2903 RepID=A0A0D3K6U1_EMIH1|nr:hypothetical protein EMIHUDRAFT_364989 [Emiliania huxleyi CCMP1516]EOD31476.1 hypothetical protein EMIHUDRAFT_364989 [Emiliania huxleyi CCMP1516]|eukprot:XP_005783905.1 hypothetical protein EMIHUDRAFT_364989 [Emiliania huxleyi CCMP1516]
MPGRRGRRSCALIALAAPSASAWTGCWPARGRVEPRVASDARMVLAMRPSAPAALGSSGADVAEGEKVGVLLLNLGGPDTLDQVEPFLYNLFSDPEIITLPGAVRWLNGPLAWRPGRPPLPAVRRRYRPLWPWPSHTVTCFGERRRR